MIIECFRCNDIVNAKELGVKACDIDLGVPCQYMLLECPKCDSALLGFSILEDVGKDKWEFLSASRYWPGPSNHGLHHSVPKEVRKALNDAHKCFNAEVYSGTTVMCGKAIESICKEKTGAKTIVDGLNIMKEQGDINGKIWDWADALRKERNLGAHATGYDPTRENAKDILSFAVAICDYVYVLTEQYGEYMARKNIGEVKYDLSEQD